MNPASPLSGADAHQALAARRLVIAAVVVALLGCSATAYWLWVLRDHRIQFTSRQVRLQTAALAEHASVVFNAVELSRGVSGTGDDRVIGVADNKLVDDFFARVSAAKDAQAGLFTLDGTRLGGSLTLRPAQGATGGAATELRELLAASTDGGIERGSLFVSAQRVPGLPMIAVSSRDRTAVLAPWDAYVASAAIAVLLGLALLAFIVHRLLGEMRARAEAQAALEHSREQARLASEAAQRARRLESLGRLASGIAHDFNNILAVILGFGDLLGRGLAPGSAQAQHADQVMRAGERGKDLVARILAFGRGNARPRAAIDVEKVVGEVLDLWIATAPSTIRFERVLNAPGAIVLGDASQLFEALNNLCANALHAMPRGGNLRIATATLQVDSARPLSHGTLQPGSYVRIVVGDEGLGMPAEVLEHLFEPFFTTRQSQGGNGLGLAMVHAAVTEMGGAVDVASAPDRGAAFALHLPLADQALAVEDAVASRITPRGRGQVVMVVDDEPALVALAEEVLADLGYEPAGFRDPALALEVLRRAPERFDALLTDQLMPGVSGMELAQAMHALRPDAPILLTTGFSGGDLDERAHDAGVSVLLRKPVHRSELAQQLARLLA